jgi:adenosine deaminase
VIDPDVLRALPKFELHCHLEGSLRATTMIELADRNGVPLPSREPDELFGYDDLAGFLAVYEVACAALSTPADFARATYEALEDAATISNIKYREMFFNPSLHPGLAYQDMLAGILDGLDAAQADLGILCRLIPSIYRQLPLSSALEMVALVAEHRTDDVVGIGMDGDEIADPPARFAPAYAAAGRAGLRLTAHVAHDAPSSFIPTCLDDLGCERVDHGYHVVDDPALMARLAKERVPFLCAPPTPPLCGWPSSLDESPIRRMIDGGLMVIINSDDPTMLHTDLATEYIKVCNGWDLPASRVRQLIADSIDASWLDETAKSALAASMMPEVDTLLAVG